MARGGRSKRKKREASEEGEPKHAVGRLHAALVGGLVGAGAGAVFAAEWLEDLELLVPLAAGGALVTAVLAAVMGDKVWETITDWL
ncbi:MAG: hypothetical protein IPG17_21580 [Sandaracinaceae bacterium]|jgi:hypothetical protein|nr:hypothetical protein [Sandaracinaceae bacterium]MBP7682428.1 hypothetical protein [Deltaproteobacteria bacterium]MBK7154262.1 hypothetical protein [Sandaracinaceae bacterium]MBK7774888.1 hypothetical protein [Sandaracinaceae bacterium]MBK8411888.1 hypothetical protein [Sandaracinaceae bacterium]